jgi:hypothetical protein
MKESRDLWADVKKDGVQGAAKKYGYAESTLYERWKPRKEELKQKIWETKKAHPNWTNKQIKEKLGIYFSESMISRIINEGWKKEFASLMRKHGSFDRMMTDLNSKKVLLAIPKSRKLLADYDFLRENYQEIFKFHLGMSRTTVLSVLKEFFTYLAIKGDEKAKTGLFLQLPRYPLNLDPVDIEDRTQALIRQRFYTMKQIDNICLKNGINLMSMLWDSENLEEAVFIIYNLKRALRYKLTKSWGAKNLEEVLTICKKIIALAKLTNRSEKFKWTA